MNIKLLELYDFVVSGAYWSYDSKILALYDSGLPGVRLYTNTFDYLRRIPNTEQRPASVSWDPRGLRLAIADFMLVETPQDRGGHTVRVWDANSGEVLSLLYDDEIKHGQQVRWSPDGSEIACQLIYPDNPYTHVIICNPDSGEVLLTLETDGTRPYGIEWSPDSQKLISRGERGLRVWNARTGEQIAALLSDVHSWLSWHPDSQRIVTGSTDRTARIWDIDTSDEIVRLEGFTESVDLPPEIQIPRVHPWIVGIEWSDDGNFIVGEDNNSVVHVWNPATGERLLELPNSIGLSLHPGSRVLAVSDKASITLWDLIKQRPVGMFSPELNWPVRSILWSPDGEYLFGADRAENMCLLSQLF